MEHPNAALLQSAQRVPVQEKIFFAFILRLKGFPITMHALWHTKYMLVLEKNAQRATAKLHNTESPLRNAGITGVQSESSVECERGMRSSRLA